MTQPRILFLNGPNANLYGLDAKGTYGTESFPQIEARCRAHAKSIGAELDFRQSNHEGELIDWIQEAREKGCAIVINPAGYGHTSVAILDALKAAELPVVECHLSNPAAREDFRRHTYVSLAATGVVSGFGAASYELAVEAAAGLAR